MGGIHEREVATLTRTPWRLRLDKKAIFFFPLFEQNFACVERAMKQQMEQKKTMELDALALDPRLLPNFPFQVRLIHS